jgi:hypothetical protein
MALRVIEDRPGDLHELARLGDVATLDLLCLDERTDAQPVSLAKKAAARFEDVALLARLA